MTGWNAHTMICEHMQSGDSRAALVVRVDPMLFVAAYTDEQDAVLLLQFPRHLVDAYRLVPGTRLLTVNTYGRGRSMMPDITPGPQSTGQWTNFYPIIAEFVSDSRQVIEQRKRRISEAEWKRASSFAHVKLASPGFTVRDGRPLQSMKPGAAPRN